MSEKFRFENNTIEQSYPKKGRTLKMYEEMLDLRVEDLRGQTVLDLGSGPGGKFSKDLQMDGIDADVISLSPDFKEERHRDLLDPTLVQKIKAGVRGKILEKPTAVAALGEALPFKDESFDTVLALYSTSRYSHHHEQWIREVCRVLKEGGMLKAGPFQGNVNYLVPTLEDLGYVYEFKETKGFEKTKFADDFEEGMLLHLLTVKKVKKDSLTDSLNTAK